MSNRPSQFAQHFRSHVGPRIRHLCRWQGLRVALGDASFADAHATIMQFARDRGALYLESGLYDDLSEHVTTWLSKAIDAAEPAVEAARERAERVARDIARYERDYAGAA